MAKFDTITGPSYWASYLINGDDSGISEDEKAMADKWLELNQVRIVSTTDEEPRFTWSYRLYNPFADCSGGDVMDYVCEYLGAH